MHNWCCLLCGKQGVVGKGYRNLNNSLRTHSKNSHNSNSDFLIISEYGNERVVEIRSKENESNINP